MLAKRIGGWIMKLMAVCFLSLISSMAVADSVDGLPPTTQAGSLPTGIRKADHALVRPKPALAAATPVASETPLGRASKTDDKPSGAFLWAAMCAFPWTAVSAFAAVVGLAFTIYFQIKNWKRTWMSNSAKMVADLVARFESPAMKEKRRDFAEQMLRTGEIDVLNTDQPVLDFFEEIGYQTRREILDVGMVWNSFHHWFRNYYAEVADHLVDEKGTRLNLLEKAREGDGRQSIYREIEWLYKTLSDQERKENPSTDVKRPSPATRREFLQKERDLEPKRD